MFVQNFKLRKVKRNVRNKYAAKEEENNQFRQKHKRTA